MKYSSVLIVTYGRSGSTLLQALLNSIDGCVVRGENYNLCYGLYLAHESLMQSKAEFGGKESRDVSWPWFGAEAFDSDRFILDARQLIRHQLIAETEEAKAQCLGFKEIRYLADNLYSEPGKPVDHFPGYLDFLSKVFPDPAFIFLTRDHEQVIKSAWWKSSNAEQARSILQGFEAKTRAYSEGKSWTFHITYRDIVERSPRLKAMYEFLGATYEDKRVEQVLAKKHSFVMGGDTEKALRNYDLHSTEIPGLIDKIFLDDLPFRLVSEVAFNVSGVVVLNQRLSDGYSLIAMDAEGEHSVQWGIDSPIMAKTYPENPHAYKARFKAENIRITKGQPIVLSLVNAVGDRYNIIQVALSR
jgi:hypothetical protein